MTEHYTDRRKTSKYTTHDTLDRCESTTGRMVCSWWLKSFFKKITEVRIHRHNFYTSSILFKVYIYCTFLVPFFCFFGVVVRRCQRLALACEQESPFDPVLRPS